MRRAGATFAALVVAGAVYAGSNGTGTGGLQGFPSTSVNGSTVPVLSIGLLDAGAANVANNLTVGGAATVTGGVTSGSDYIISHAAGALYWNQSAATVGQISCNISAANAGATAASAALKFYPQVALDATDWVFSLGTAQNAASLFSVDYSGLLDIVSLKVVGLSESSTAPTVTACSGGTPASITSSNGSTAFVFDVGTACASESTATVTFPAATTGWICSCSITTADKMIVQRTMPASTTQAVLQHITISTGANGDFTDGADVACLCKGL